MPFAPEAAREAGAVVEDFVPVPDFVLDPVVVLDPEAVPDPVAAVLDPVAVPDPDVLPDPAVAFVRPLSSVSDSDELPLPRAIFSPSLVWLSRSLPSVYSREAWA
ncbi:hypothetical protein GCM10027615_76390 [Plantactinospora veratri]